MADEERKALARLGKKLRAFADTGEHTVLEATAWGIVLLDLSEVERGFAELEDYKKLAEKRLDLWSEDYHRLRGELKNLRDYMRGFEPWKAWAEESAVKISYPPAQEALDMLVLTLNEVREIMGVIGPALAHPETECTCSVAGHAIGCPFYVPQIEKPLSQIYIGFDRAHDKGDETSVRFYRRNDDRSITILAELRGEAAEYIAELENNFNDLSHRFSCILGHATGGAMSKTNYTKEAMYLKIDGHIQDLCDEAVKELRKTIEIKCLYWNDVLRGGRGAYACVFCYKELPRIGPMVHKVGCITNH